MTDENTSSRVGWFAIGALAASMVFVVLFVAGDVFSAVSGPEVTADLPETIIEGK